MSKLKTNDKVIVKATGKVGFIKGRDTIDLGDGRVKVEYIVKTGDGFDNWNTYSKNELEKVGVKITGILLNGTEPKTNKYYYGNYYKDE